MFLKIAIVMYYNATELPVFCMFIVSLFLGKISKLVFLKALTIYMYFRTLVLIMFCL